MLRLMHADRPVRVVADQIGSPTSADSVATALWEFTERPESNGIWHWSDAGVASWYDFAVAIGEEARSLGMLKTDPSVSPIGTAEYPTAARRPAFSVLNKQATIDALKLVPVHWRHNLRQVIREIAGA
jgi:dTDP-4-dehydrorhamnose reductase